MATFVAKTAADIVWGCCHHLANFITQGVAENLTTYAKGWPDVSDFIPAQYKWYTRKGQQYAIPVYCAGHTFLYNKKLFDEMQVPYPTDNWTWTDFRDLARKSLSSYEMGRNAQNMTFEKRQARGMA